MATALDLKPLLAAAAVFGIVFGAFEGRFVSSFGDDRNAVSSFYKELPYRKLPGFRCFLDEVRAATKDGDRIALIIPPMQWKSGYEYGYYRSVYLLSGRTVEPLIDPGNDFHPEKLATADYVACWRCDPNLPGFPLHRRLCSGVLSGRQ